MKMHFAAIDQQTAEERSKTLYNIDVLSPSSRNAIQNALLVDDMQRKWNIMHSGSAETLEQQAEVHKPWSLMDHPMMDVLGNVALASDFTSIEGISDLSEPEGSDIPNIDE